MKFPARIFFIATLILSSLRVFAADVDGIWLIPDDDNKGKIQSAVAFYEFKGLRYCKMLAIYDEDSGKPLETLVAPKQKAKAIAGNPFLCGLDFIWGLKFNPDNKRYSGHVIDPDSGKIYRCEVWYDTSKKMLVVRGELFVFGANEYWGAAPENFVPKAAIPDVKIPNLPNIEETAALRNAISAGSEKVETAQGAPTQQGGILKAIRSVLSRIR